ncbi:MAG: hypothetical protein V4463_01610 [Pseudomonadota bacterium]
MREKQARKLYLIEMLGGLGLYALLLVVALRVGPGMADGALRTLVLASPMIGFLAALWAVVRQFGRMDEYLRRTMLENLAVAAAVTAGWTFTYGFLENAGYPRLSMFTIWPAMGAVWGLLQCLRNWVGK